MQFISFQILRKFGFYKSYNERGYSLYVEKKSQSQA